MLKKNKNNANNKLIKGLLLNGSRRVDSTVRVGGKFQRILYLLKNILSGTSITVIFNSNIFNVTYLISV